jgi:general secretion pathway protein G
MTTLRRRRPGFTLIELLVVVAIIAVLMGLTAAAVMKFLAKGPEAQTRADISGLATALESCKNELNFGGKSPPSSLVLREDNNYNLNNAVEKRTKALLEQMFGKRIDLRVKGSAAGANGIDWNGDGTISNQPVTLQGHQCLVFFLGGIPTPSGATNGCTGFSKDPTNPALAGGTRYGPYFEFRADRLVRASNGFFSYLDPYKKKPFAYFSSFRTTNGYTDMDCQPDLAPLKPYKDKTGLNYIRPDSYQIISAGPDGAFGPGGNWDPTSGWGTGPGADDIANFSRGKLGGPQQ